MNYAGLKITLHKTTQAFLFYLITHTYTVILNYNSYGAGSYFFKIRLGQGWEKRSIFTGFMIFIVTYQLLIDKIVFKNDNFCPIFQITKVNFMIYKVS